MAAEKRLRRRPIHANLDGGSRSEAPEPPADQGKSGKSAPGRKSMLENKRQTTWKGEDASKKGTPKDQNAWKAETRSLPRPPERLRGEKVSIKQTSPE